MWYESMDRRYFIESLYAEIPQLTNVRIAELGIFDQGNRVSLKFDMPYFADKVPSKWIDMGYNTVFVHLDFFGISNISMGSNSNSYRGDIEIIKDENGQISVNITGVINLSLQAECGLIQKVNAYLKEN